MGRALALVGIGILLGAAGAWSLTRLIAAQLYHTSATDPATFATVAALMNRSSPDRHCAPRPPRPVGQASRPVHAYASIAFHHVPPDVRQPELAPLRLIREPQMIDPQAMQNRRLQIVHVNRIRVMLYP